MDHTMKKMLQFSLIGLALAGGLIAVLQARPSNILPFNGTFFVQVRNPSVQLAPSLVGCHDCGVTSLNLTIDSVTIHRDGELNLTGGWFKISRAATTLDVAGMAGVGQLIGQGSLPPGNVNLIRLSVSSAWAVGPQTASRVPISVPSGKIDLVLNPPGQVKSGKATTVFLKFPLSVDCGGNGDCRLKPVLVDRVFGPQ